MSTPVKEGEGREVVEARAGGVSVRECVSVEEFDACVKLQREAFGLHDLELSPRRHLIVAGAAGGFVLGAFAGERLVGFVLHQVALRNGTEPAGYSHMMAVARDYQNRGVGALLKWAQRGRALRAGQRFIKWTWDPMQARNAHFNLNRLGAVVRRYAANFYGTDYTTLHGFEHAAPLCLDSDRLVAEWELDSPRVVALAQHGEAPTLGEPAREVLIPADWPAVLRADSARAIRELRRVREEFQDALANGLVCAGFARDGERPRYLFYGER